MWKVLGNWVDRYFGDEEAVLMVLLLVLAVAITVIFDAVLLPFVVALVIAFLLQGAVNRLCARKVPRLAAVLGVFVMFLSAGLLVLIFLVPLVARQATHLVSEIPGMLRQWHEALLLLPETYPQLITEEQLSKLMDYASLEGAQFAERLLTFSVSSFPNLVVVLVYTILVPLLVFFMLKDKEELLGMLTALLPAERPVMRQIGEEMNLQMANYVRGKVIEIVVVGVASYLAFLMMGLNYAALLALLVGLSVIVPYIGATVVTIPVAMVGYFQWGWDGSLFWLLAVYGIIQMLDGNVLVPLLFSEALNLHPVAIILAVLAFGGLWGLWGVFFAIPLATLVKAVYNAWPRTEQSTPLSQ